MSDKTSKWDRVLKVVRSKWGEPRDSQLIVLKPIVEGSDVIAVLPTGGGKSLLFQAPAKALSRFTVVVSPLIALMADQVRQANDRGIEAYSIDSSMPDSKVNRILKRTAEAEKKPLLYVSPERFITPSFTSWLQSNPPRVIAIDEAHSASLWGNTFRAAYAKIHETVSKLPRKPQLLAFSATVTRQILPDIVKACGMDADKARLCAASPIRSNMEFAVLRPPNSFGVLLALTQRMLSASGRTIVYVQSRAGAEKIAGMIRHHAMNHDIDPSLVGVYHAGMRHNDNEYEDESGASFRSAGRKSTAEGFFQDRIKLVVATSAFGMGVDVPDIRNVIHFGLPLSIEDFVQAAGRGGRDGLPCVSTTIFGPRDQQWNERWLNEMFPEADAIQCLWDAILELNQGTITANEAWLTQIANKMNAGITMRGIPTLLTILRADGYIEAVPSREAFSVEIGNIRNLRSAINSNQLGSKSRRLAQYILGKADAARSTSFDVSLRELRDHVRVNPVVAIKHLVAKSSVKISSATSTQMISVVSDAQQIKESTRTKMEVNRSAALIRWNALMRFINNPTRDNLERHFIPPTM